MVHQNALFNDVDWKCFLNKMLQSAEMMTSITNAVD